MRGTPGWCFRRSHCLGIIPAYAGNTVVERAIKVPAGDHPRVCGEHIAQSVTSMCAPGSSPRMRGTRSGFIRGSVPSGIIPAYAGNTCIRQRQPFSSRDHPRVCGEHVRRVIRGRRRKGSSPRMRGTQSTSSKSDYCRGIIPAYAGNTQSNTMRGASVWDHPRVCGEHLVTYPLVLVSRGSSPRMRGTQNATSPYTGV